MTYDDAEYERMKQPTVWFEDDRGKRVRVAEMPSTESWRDGKWFRCEGYMNERGSWICTKRVPIVYTSNVADIVDMMPPAGTTSGDLDDKDLK